MLHSRIPRPCAGSKSPPNTDASDRNLLPNRREQPISRRVLSKTPGVAESVPIQAARERSSLLPAPGNSTAGSSSHILQPRSKIGSACHFNSPDTIQSTPAFGIPRRKHTFQHVAEIRAGLGLQDRTSALQREPITSRRKRKPGLRLRDNTVPPSPIIGISSGDKHRLQQSPLALRE